MIYHIITTQPKIYQSWLKTGLIARSIKKGIIKIDLINLYDYGQGVHKSVDDTPYGGGAGMILKVDILDKALLKIKNNRSKPKIILLTPQGNKFDNKTAKTLSREKELILIAGRFEGYDERVRQLADLEISIGDYILTSGDLPAQVIIEATSRQINGFISKSQALKEETFENNLLEYPQYTKPKIYKNKKVPEILLSGNHQKIAQWRYRQMLKKTKKLRPDLDLTNQE